MHEDETLLTVVDKTPFFRTHTPIIAENTFASLVGNLALPMGTAYLRVTSPALHGRGDDNDLSNDLPNEGDG